jgi:hypothetical protein
MISRTEQLATKRRALQLHCALQRQQLAFMTVNVEARLVTVDRILEIASGAVRNPIVIVAALAGLTLLKPWKLLRWAGRAWLLFSLGRKIRGWAAKEE